MPRLPGMHRRKEPTFPAQFELDIPRRASGLGAALKRGLAQTADAGVLAQDPFFGWDIDEPVLVADGVHRCSHAVRKQDGRRQLMGAVISDCGGSGCTGRTAGSGSFISSRE